MKLDLAFPCTEDLDNMPDTEKGKFCHQCSKEVIDFTAMSKQEVVQILSKKKSCGIFRNDQLDKVHKPIVHIKPRKHFIKMAVASMSVFVLSLFGCDNSMRDYDANTNGRSSCNNKANAKPRRTLGIPIPPKISVGDTIYTPEEKKVEEINKVGEVKSIPKVGFTAPSPPPSKSDKLQEPEVFGIVEVMPSFPGGEDSLINYLAKHIQYPNEECSAGVVYVEFVVEKDGSITNCEVKKGITESANNAALRVIQNMPKWIPGKQGEDIVAVSYVIPIEFTLE